MAAPAGTAASDGDVLRLLRAGTAAEHDDVERSLGLLDPGLDRPRLVEVLGRLHGFWIAAEAGLDAWAGSHREVAEPFAWPRRRRAQLYAADLRTLGAQPDASAPALPPVTGTDEALGRMYVLEGSTLGGALIDRHLAGLPTLDGVRLRAFSPYGHETGAMWHAFRQATRAHVAAAGNAATVVSSARDTFVALARWCRPAGRRAATTSS